MIFGIKLVYFTRFLRVKNYPGAKSYPKLLQSSLKVTEALLTRISVVCAANPICCVIKSDGSNQWYWPDPQTVQLCGKDTTVSITEDWLLTVAGEGLATFRKPSGNHQWNVDILQCCETFSTAYPPLQTLPTPNHHRSTTTAVHTILIAYLRLFTPLLLLNTFTTPPLHTIHTRGNHHRLPDSWVFP